MLVGVADDDTAEDRDWLARKIVSLRIFDDDAGVMNRAVDAVGGDVLAVSQFTLYASTRKGNRPSWSRAAPPDVARAAVRRVRRCAVRQLGKAIAVGRFGARHAGIARERRTGHDRARLANPRVAAGDDARPTRPGRRRTLQPVRRFGEIVRERGRELERLVLAEPMLDDCASRGSGTRPAATTSWRAGIDRNARVSSLKPTVLENPAVSIACSRKRSMPWKLSWNHHGGPSFSAG